MKQIEFALRTKALELALAAVNGHYEVSEVTTQRAGAFLSFLRGPRQKPATKAKRR